MSSHTLPKRQNRLRNVIGSVFAAVCIYSVGTYVILPALWRYYEHNPKLEYSPKVTQTSEGVSGDPLNVGLVGTKEEVVGALLTAGWYPADPITLRSGIGNTSVELSHYTGQITHRIDADIDEERDTFMSYLEKAHQINSEYQVTGVGATLQGRNGGGDYYYTDG
ncbi:MAG: LssY C-terminal domain-containing protein [Calothrix sp. FI2-JRJ7]|jgi:hypothetical protein|nr:LssY C-terminal domain-containing protein [Calothrix sp. FI2-JRJ7]